MARRWPVASRKEWAPPASALGSWPRYCVCSASPPTPREDVSSQPLGLVSLGHNLDCRLQPRPWPWCRHTTGPDTRCWHPHDQRILDAANPADIFPLKHSYALWD